MPLKYIFSRCSAVGSALGLGPRCREFESLHLDHAKSPLSVRIAGFNCFSPTADFTIRGMICGMV